MLLDRGSERSAIDQLLDGARNASSGVIVLRGPPGIGKSALLDYAITQAADFTVARVTGVESEIGLGFAAVHQLLLPFIDRIVELPDPQRHALQSVFGLADQEAPNSLLVFLAVLTLLDRAARDRPMLLVVDDAQWLDQESARVLTFVARRLHADPVAMIFAVRDTGLGGPDVFSSLPRLELSGLPDCDARSLLEQVVGGKVDAEVADSLVRQTEGNPLALTEVVAALTAEQVRGEAPLPDPIPVGPLLQEEFAARARLLPPAGRAVLVLASAERMGDPAVLRRAAAEMEVPWEDGVGSVEAARLATFGGTVRFRHPLIRSAVYHAATPAERRRAHRALADALGADDEIDRRAWHLAAAAPGPDEQVAVALEQASARVFHRGGTQAAATFLLRTAELSLDPGRRVDRLLAAIRMRAAAGDSARAQPLLDTALTRVRDGRQRAEAEWTQGLIWLNQGRARDAVRALARAVASIERYDRDLPLDALITAENAMLYAGSLCEGVVKDQVAQTVLRLVPGSDALTPTEHLVRGIALLQRGDPAAAPALRTGLAGLSVESEDGARIVTAHAHERANIVHLLSVNAAVALLDDEALQTATQSWVDFARRTRTMTMLPIALDVRSVVEIFAGRTATAASLQAEADEILSVVGSRGHIGHSGIGGLFLHAHLGDEGRTRAVAERRSHDARERGSGIDIDHSHYALAVLHLGWGRYPEALAELRQLHVHDAVPLSVLGLPMLIEAAVRCDDLALATAGLDRFAERATASGARWALGLLALTRALLSSGAKAEAEYRVALGHLAAGTMAFDLARAQLLYGEWLRRSRRRRDARPPLRAALECFERMGANAFAERTRRELAATGEQARPRSDATRNLLTAQEAEIARLVGEGRSNAEIASQLFISLRTVEYHLHKVYRKLGVTSRTQLARLGRSG